MKIVFVNTSDDNAPSGGAKQAYRHIDVLNQIGIDAYFVHPTPGFRYSWFDNQTKVVHSDDVSLTSDDFMIFGELVPEVPKVKGWDRCGRVILCQNQYNALGGFHLDLMNIRHNFREAAAILCPSEYATSCVRFMFPSSRVMRFQYSFDREPWGYSAQKDKLIAVMPRKRGDDINAVLAVSGVNWIAPGWNLFRMDGLHERDVAKALKRCSVFLSLNDREGFGMPPCEAMACGCVVVGYDGYSGVEYMKPGITMPVTDGDFIALTRSLLSVLAQPMETNVETGRKASEFVRSTYSTQAEVESIKKAWDSITRNVIEVRTDARERMKKEVAVYMPVYNEGPYMEALLKWLYPRVAAIFVAESTVPWTIGGKPGGESKAVVDKVISECPDAKSVIRYMVIGDEDKNAPLNREANQRNDVLKRIEESGFRYVWMVEADEFYRNEDAEMLWDWFFQRVEDGARTARCKWQTYWRSIHWRVDPPEMFRPNVAFVSDCRFDHGRVMSVSDEKLSVDVPERVCVVRHYSWARTPADVRKKIAVWGHSGETNPEWFDKVFMTWVPGHPMENVHPSVSVPMAYKRIVRCELPLPEAMENHPYVGMEIIEDTAVKPAMIKTETSEIKRHRIKAVIMHHNKPANADKLYDQLAPVFDDVEIFDNGSDPNLIPIHVTRSRENVYWTGTWNEVISTCSEYDAVWVLGCDVELKNLAIHYREAIESSLPFGCWSPCVDGRAHPFMQAKNYADKMPKRVRNIEGMAMAVSGSLMRTVGELMLGSKIGFGQDFWLCYRARMAKLNNIIDGRVVVYHPEGSGYDDAEASRQMDETFSKMYGPDFRQKIFQYDSRYEFNLVMGGSVMPEKKFTIVTVDNGWGLSEFMRITSKIENARRIVMRKGVIENMAVPGFEMVPYEENLSLLIQEADVAFFPRVGTANKTDYEKLLKAGIATVVRNVCDQGMVQHMKTGWIFQDESWASYWLQYLRDNPKELERVKREKQAEPNVSSVLSFPSDPTCAVTVITPTYKRSLDVIRRCIGSMILQTEKDWEQLVCSDGEAEVSVRDLVASLGDSRIKYRHTAMKKVENDYGNTVRAEMLKQARGRYVMFLDDDNVILPDFISKMISTLEGAGSDLVVCKIMHFGPLNEKEVGKPPKVLSGDPVKLYHIDPLQVLVKREVMQKVGWDTTVGYLSDGVSLEKLASCKIARVNEVLGIHM